MGTVVRIQGVVPTRVMIVHENITPLKLTEESLRESRDNYQAALEMFQKIFQHNPSPLALSNAVTGEFVRVNEAFQKTVGYGSPELLGRTVRELGLFPDQELQQQAAHTLLETGILEGCELNVRTRSGELRTGVFSGAVIATSGERLILSVMSDITERKQFEEELLLSRTLADAANRAKSSFLATMSHELRTPLNSILGMCEVLGEPMLGVLTDEQRYYLTVIDESGRHLLALINDILDLSRIEADKLEPELVPLELEELCRASLTFVREMAFKKQIALAISLKGTPHWFTSDLRRLKQILINLLGNAVKFTPEGGEVGLDVVGDPERQELRFIVRDTGIGIAPYDLEKLFNPFVQVDSALSRRYEGTGLGLTLVARLSELLGGEVAVTSEPGRGSRFSVIFPWTGGEADPGAGLFPDEISCPGNLHEFQDEEPLILLAEDNKDSREMVTDYLQTKEYRIATAETGVEAIALAKELRPDLILMDVQMPVMDGLTAMREIRNFPPPGCDVPIIALTALVMPGDRERCLEAGADAYMDKPLSLRKLSKLIRELLTSRASLSR
jgi:PAS domain S-box-containing protein